MSELTLLAQRILDRAEIEPGHNVLDLGAGQGLLARGAIERGAKVVAVDLLHQQVRLSPGSPLVGDAASLPFANDCFDRVLMRSMLVWTERRAEAVSEAARVLRPGGLLSGSESINARLEIDVKHQGLSDIWKVLERALGSLQPVSLSEATLADLLELSGLRGVDLHLEKDVHEDWDPLSFFFDQRGPGSFTLGEFLVSGGISPELLTGFVNGLSKEGSTLTTYEALFRATK